MALTGAHRPVPVGFEDTPKGDWLDWIESLAWQEWAQCRGEDPARWYPGKNPLAIAAAVAFCEGCPVLVECGQYGIAHSREGGVWGGLPEKERKRIRRARARR